MAHIFNIEMEWENLSFFYKRLFYTLKIIAYIVAAEFVNTK
jgi:hypothetical protein